MLYRIGILSIGNQCLDVWLMVSSPRQAISVWKLEVDLSTTASADGWCFTPQLCCRAHVRCAVTARATAHHDGPHTSMVTHTAQNPVTRNSGFT